MSAERHSETAPLGFDSEGWPLPEVRSLMIDNFVRSWQRHWFAVLVLFGVAFFFIVFATWLVTPRYEGQAKAMIYPQSLPMLGLADEALGPSGGLDTEKMTANVVEVMKSREVLREVAARTGLADHFQSQAGRGGPRGRIKRAIGRVVMLPFRLIRGGRAQIDWDLKAYEELRSTWISVAPLERSTMIPLTIYGDNPDKTVEVGDAVFEVVQEKMDAIFLDYIDRQIIQAGQLVQTQEELVDQLRGELESIQTELGYSDPDQYERLTVQTLVDLEKQASLAQTEIEETEAAIAEAERNLADIEQKIVMQGEGIDERPEIGGYIERLRNDLADARAELDQLLTRYAPGSPRVVEQQARVSRYEEEIQTYEEAEIERTRHGETQRTSEQLDPRFVQVSVDLVQLKVRRDGLAARKPALEATIQTFKEERRQAVAQQGRLRDKTDEVRIAEADLRDIKGKLSSFETLKNEQHPFKSLMITEHCSVNNRNDADLPNMMLAGILAIIVGAFTALVLPVAYDYISQVQLSSRQATTIPGLRVAAVVPRMRKNAMFKSVSG